MFFSILVSARAEWNTGAVLTNCSLPPTPSILAASRRAVVSKLANGSDTVHSLPLVTLFGRDNSCTKLGASKNLPRRTNPQRFLLNERQVADRLCVFKIRCFSKEQ